MSYSNYDITNAISQLKAYKHSNSTNFAKKTLSNHDACAYLLFKCGPMKRKEIKSALTSWRGGRQAFAYLFNAATWGGYGYIGKSSMSTGNWVSYHGSLYGHIHEHCSNDGCTFRRTYWHRPAKGVYAPTLECAKRMTEISHFFS